MKPCISSPVAWGTILGHSSVVVRLWSEILPQLVYSLALFEDGWAIHTEDLTVARWISFPVLPVFFKACMVDMVMDLGGIDPYFSGFGAAGLFGAFSGSRGSYQQSIWVFLPMGPNQLLVTKNI